MSQTSQLETLQRRRDLDYEFVRVVFGGPSPTVSLASPTGEIRYAEFSAGYDRAIERMIAAIGAR